MSIKHVFFDRINGVYEKYYSIRFKREFSSVENDLYHFIKMYMQEIEKLTMDNYESTQKAQEQRSHTHFRHLSQFSARISHKASRSVISISIRINYFLASFAGGSDLFAQLKPVVINVPSRLIN